MVATSQGSVDSTLVKGLTSDLALAELRPGLEQLGYIVESGKTKAERISRPVLFGEQGAARLTYDVDAVHDDLGVVVEVEAGRGARGNAVYRDLVRASLIIGVRFLALGVMPEYHQASGGKPIVVQSYAEARRILDAVYASGQLVLPFEGLLLFGY